MFDRYLLFLIPGALAVAASTPAGELAAAVRPGRTLVAWVAVLGLWLCSVGLMHDWLAWNAARWALGRRAVARGTDALHIEGGFEWDGWHAPLQEKKSASPSPPRQRPVLRLTEMLFPTVEGRYVLSFEDFRGLRVVDAEPYAQWLLPGKRRFYLVEVPALPPQPVR
jgi:hypothetical protein